MRFKDSTGNAVLMLVVVIGANRQSCDPSIILLFKLVLEVVHAIAAGCADTRTPVHRS